jgi:FAD/FMN-containing dehydrogenase/Fe-S oxidoreductase
MSLTSLQRAALTASACPWADDLLTRQLHATDASLYRVEPKAVAFPRSAPEAAAVLRAARETDLPVAFRGAGSGLVGGALSPGLVLDLARHNQTIGPLDPERRTIRAGAGVVLDQLNAHLAAHGLIFGADVATSSRATLGGMIANDSSGARVTRYGTTIDHLNHLELLLPDGRVADTGNGLEAERSAADALVQAHAAEIERCQPPGLHKRRPGYALRRFLHAPNCLSHLVCGSEGTLAGIWSAEVRAIPLPRTKGLGLIFFASVAEAMQATVALQDLEPVAIEHMDRVLFDQTRSQTAFRTARDLLDLDQQPCEGILLVEFHDGDVADKLRQLTQRRLGLRHLALKDAARQNLVWNLRKAGLSLLTGCRGSAKPVTGIEDTVVAPAQLPAYVAGLEEILRPLNLSACYYGHASAGLLHVRPVLDLHLPGDRAKFRLVADAVSALVRQFQGSLAGEHGVGMARTEYLPEHLGEEFLGVMRGIKQIFDPDRVLNPGKMIPDGRYRIDTRLRCIEAPRPILPFKPRLAFAARDGGFLPNLEQCNGCGGCRKLTPTMCPTFPVTGEESLSTRGRANTIQAALTGRLGESPLTAPGLWQVLDTCLSCKACATECPSNVNLPLLKAELQQARHDQHGMNLSARVFSRVDLLGEWGCRWPSAANALLRLGTTRWLLQKLLGLATERPLPPYTRQRFDHWFARRPTHAGPRGEVILWDDTFVRYHEPHIGQAAVAVLEAAGFTVRLLTDRRCCGRPAFSQGNLRAAAALGRHNLARLNALGGNAPILFLEPSCHSMVAMDYRELKLAGAEAVAERCWLLEEFVAALLEREPEAIAWQPRPDALAIHAHCHTKSLRPRGSVIGLAHRLAASATVLETGCCGMAGAFGHLAKHQALSRQVAQPLLEQLARYGSDSVTVASGTSCRQQIADLAGRPARHLVEVMAERLRRP